MTPQELDNMTPRQFHNRLNGWRQGRELESLERWQQARAISSFVLSIGQWKKGKEPDIMKLMPLPGDQRPEDNYITISDEEMARRKYKILRAFKARLNPEFAALVRKHYQPDWGPHPDELVKPKD